MPALTLGVRVRVSKKVPTLARPGPWTVYTLSWDLPSHYAQCAPPFVFGRLNGHPSVHQLLIGRSACRRHVRGPHTAHCSILLEFTELIYIPMADERIATFLRSRVAVSYSMNNSRSASRSRRADPHSVGSTSAQREGRQTDDPGRAQ